MDLNLDYHRHHPNRSNVNLSTVDSAVDLTSFPRWPNVKLEPMENLPNFPSYGESVMGSNTPSPSADMIFSQANSPGDMFRDQSQSSTPQSRNDSLGQDVKPQVTEDLWSSLHATQDAIHIPQNVEPPKVFLCPDKTKTRAETQIKVQLILDPVDDRFEHMHFPRKTLAKPKLLASTDEQMEIEAKGEILHMDLFLVCATAVDNKESLEQAKRRAAGNEDVPSRPPGVTIAELDKEDAAHPQNGGEVLICEGCKERERKRYDRKKKRAEDEDEWWSYEDQRVIMINEKEYKKWKDVESADGQYSSSAKQVEFAMRIACYCRHQEEKSPVGYRVIFTFKDDGGVLITQHVSEIFQITDDHKNKEVATEAMPRSLGITQQQYMQMPHPSVLPLYQLSLGNQYNAGSLAHQYSQPPTPVGPNFQSSMETQFSQSSTPPSGPPPRQQIPPVFTGSSSSAQAPQFSHPPAVYDTPMLSPTNHVPSDAFHLTRPMSMENFNFTSQAQAQAQAHYRGQNFASAPQSSASTPINLSRPASPSWDQGPKAKRLHCVYFYVEGN
ncbi:hypothetical protein K504DRAFT_375925 [Pleomassaria siparia CBS 279.74]|uniref:SPT23/MGA2-like DNA-binding domain-containing protein n=1 Tax=Pleomassaria siparia CBS 279.74 TaxID=1314801 RepID=A0A6G1KEL9_9PLEO|nr:hypothetical protein K504DRAFT_375925 [Pleomassaria siparia CBS 279.74]